MTRCTRRHVVLVGLALLSHAGVATAQKRAASPATSQWPATPLTATSDAAAQQATRVLVARSVKLNKVGWLEARSTFRPGVGLTYVVVREGGDAGIRNRVLRRVLDNEVEMSSPGRAPRMALSEVNYELRHDADGRTVRLAPRRKEATLIDGTARLDASGRLLTIEGRLAKSPSFWVRSVSVRRTYQTFDGRALPVLVESTADVRLAGACEFAMWIDYDAVDGRRVERATSSRLAAGAEPSRLLVALQLQRLR